MKRFLALILWLIPGLVLAQPSQPAPATTPLTRSMLRQTTAAAVLDALGIVTTNATVVVPPDYSSITTNGSGQLIASNAVRSASTLWVDPNGASAGFSNAYSNFRGAVAAAVAGQTVKVNAGTYDEGTNIIQVGEGISIDIDPGATILFTPSTSANNGNMSAQINFAGSNIRIFGGGKIISTPTNAQDDSIIVGIGKGATANLSNIVVDGLELQGDATGIRNMSTNTVSWEVKNCTFKTTQGGIQGVSGTSTFSSSNTFLHFHDNVVYNTNNSILNSTSVRRAFTLGVFGGRALIERCTFIPSDHGCSTPTETFENKTSIVPRWVTNAVIVRDCSIDATGQTNASSYQYEIQAGNSFVLQNVSRTDGAAFTHGPLSSPIAITWIPTRSGAVNIASGSVPAASELAAITGGTNDIRLQNSNGVPVVLWTTDGSTLSMADLTLASQVTITDNRILNFSGVVNVSNASPNTGIALTSSNVNVERFNLFEALSICTSNAGTATASLKTWTNASNGSFVQVGSAVRWITNFNGYWHIMLATGATEAYTNATMLGQYTSAAGGLDPAPMVTMPITLRSHHIQGITNTANPTITAGAGAGTGPTVSIVGTDLAGEITVTTGSSPSTASTIATITFNTAYTLPPYPVLYPSEVNACDLAFRPYVTRNATTFTISSGATALGASTTYKWHYIVIQ